MNIENEVNLRSPEGLRGDFIIDPNRITIYRDSFNELKLKVDGEVEYSDVKIIRAFPISDPRHYIALKGIKNEENEKAVEEKQEKDSSRATAPRAKEIGIIKDIRDLDSQSRKVVEEELEMMYFTPKITRINRIKSERGSYKWIVETDRGDKEFEVRHREDIRIMQSNRIMVKDVDGNRFEIPNYSRLDSNSRSMIEKYL